MKTIISTLVLSLALSATAMAEPETVSTTTIAQSGPATNCVCVCQARRPTREEALRDFMKELRAGGLNEPGIAIEDAGLPNT